MPTLQASSLDFNNAARILNLPDAVSAQQPATYAQLTALLEGLAYKDNARVATSTNVNLAAPGASLDGISMVAGDRFVARGQTAGAENGIYVWNGAATPATRSLDANTGSEITNAMVVIDQGTDAAVQFRQSVVNPTIGSTTITWVSYGTSAPAASETTPGILEIATQAEADAGADDLRAITPLKLATLAGRNRRFEASIGDGSATSFAINHNFNSRAVHVTVYRNSGNFDTIGVDVQRTSVNQVTIVFDAAVVPTAAQFAVLITR